ncbi:MAG TPA: pro-sigmaK processing inhibitor BofA family protein [Clostridia bacterium]|nr:pro-sigmaK processing inhibitor BofA family protein [Clostridia bacterium]
MGLGLKIFLSIVTGLAVIIVLGQMVKSGHGFKGLFLTAIQGVIAIFAVNTAGLVTGVTVAVNWYTLGFGMLLGTPGVVSLLVMNTVFK